MNINQKEESCDLVATNKMKINSINFTSREIDVIACILGGRAPKKIASFLSIAPRTVEIHIRNIMLKIGCNSRESMIDFIEKSNKLEKFKKHYFSLLVNLSFTKELKKISIPAKEQNINCLIFYYKTQKAKKGLINDLEDHLSLIGIKVISKVWEKDKTNAFIDSNIKTGQINYIIYLIDDEFIERLQGIEDKIIEETKNIALKFIGVTNPIIFLSLNKDNTKNFYEKLTDLTHINLLTSENYYFLFFELLTTILLSQNIDKFFMEFKKQYETFNSASVLKNSVVSNELKIHNSLAIKTLSIVNINHLIKSFRLKWLIFLISPIFVSFTVFKINKEIKFLTHKSQNIEKKFVTSNINKPPKLIKSKIIMNLPPRNNKFTGRKTALKKIQEQLNQQQSGMMLQAISGLGGVGKTQLATEFAYLAVEKNNYDVVLFITAESPASINNAYRKLAESLRIDTRGLKPSEVKMVIHDKLLENYKDCKILFILDNAPNYNNVRNYIEELQNQLLANVHFHMLVTSRSQYWPENLLILESFTTEDALLFVKKHLTDEKENSIFRLIEKLYCFPLALNQAVAYIKEYTNIDDYLELYKAREKDYLNQFTGEKNQYTESLWKTWTIALSKLRDDARQILFTSAYLYSDDIPIELFHNLTLENRVKAMGDLRKHSFIILTNNNKAFKIHKLLQEVIRLTTQFPAKNTWLNNAISLLETKFDFNYHQPEKWNEWGKYLIHARSVAEQAITIKKSVFQPEVKIYLKVIMFMTYIQLDLKEVFPMWLRILNLTKNDNNDLTYIITAIINSNLGYITRYTVYDVGKFEESRKYLEEAILIYKNAQNKYSNVLIPKEINETINGLRLIPLSDNMRLLEQTQYDLCLALTRLGNNSRALGEYDKTIIYYNEALAILRKCEPNIGCKYQHVQILRELATVYTYTGNFIKAENTLHIAKALCNEAFINHHILQIYANEALSMFMYHIGKFKEAKKILENSLEIKTVPFSKFHLGIANINISLGGINNMCSNPMEAETNLKQAEKTYGMQHKNTYYGYIFLYMRFSRVYESLKQYDKALYYLNQTLDLAKLHYRDKLSIAMAFQLTQAEVWPNLTKYNNISYWQNALETTKQVFGNNHYQAARYYYMLGQALEHEHKFQEANKHYKQALVILNSQEIRHQSLKQFYVANIRKIQLGLQRTLHAS